jgi:hypothetical protein
VRRRVGDEWEAHRVYRSKDEAQTAALDVSPVYFEYLGAFPEGERCHAEVDMNAVESVTAQAATLPLAILLASLRTLSTSADKGEMR